MGMIVSFLQPKDKVPDFIEFTAEDVTNIKRTWVLPHEHPMDVGEKILYKYFETFPVYQEFFEHFKNYPLLTLKGAPGFRTHAGRMIRVFDSNVDVLAEGNIETEMEKIWLPIARSHYRREIPQKAFRDFRTIAVEGLQELCNLTEAECKSYKVFFNNVHHVVFEGLEAVAKLEGHHHHAHNI
ncbi:unnamed protein product [Hermetia illucens]|uniref:Globin domain-containing protein n=1 Tax=Hermetia illucens TaxID=343691 RepID=A0A7R8UCQ4_HERIL|nr:globin CTT-I/CTT-IA-like [Hermetia illucens]CAD7078293.1 unnamed protein product [Hermetia illucens]